MQNKKSRYLSRAIELARRGAGSVSPNPMVGSVIVRELKDSNGEVIEEIVGEGYHMRCGEAHAEVNAIRDVEARFPKNYMEVLSDSTIYVTLEPCSHYGKTPPCADKIIEMGIPRVVVGCLDPFEKVSGRGIERLRAAGVEVEVGVMESECRELNARFITSQIKKSPYVILKLAESKDGYLDIIRDSSTSPACFTGADEKRLVHQLRAQEDALMVGRRSVEMDNPSLTVREVEGINPMRVVLDGKGVLRDGNYSIFNGEAPTVIYTSVEGVEYKNSESVVLDYSKNVLDQVLSDLYSRGVQSLIVEGGAVLLTSFLEAQLWDEAQVFTSQKSILEYYSQTPLNEGSLGVKAPGISQFMEAKMEYHPRLVEQVQFPDSQLLHYFCREW